MSDYRHGAACRDLDPEIFFPVSEETGAAPALAVCATCPVREACLEWALERGEEGVWGGTVTEDRRRLRLVRRRSAFLTYA